MNVSGRFLLNEGMIKYHHKIQFKQIENKKF